MDGTLTVPCIDFKAMRRAVGVPDGEDILDFIARSPPEGQARAHAAIQSIEAQALQDMQVMPGALPLCAHLDAAGVPRALVTRNVLSSVHHFHTHHIVPAAGRPFAPAISRECGLPYKPSPAALLHICDAWGIAPEEAVMVGDSIKDDIVSGNRAGAHTVLLDWQGQGGHSAEALVGEEKPTLVVHSLTDLIALLEAHFHLQPPSVVLASAG